MAKKAAGQGDLFAAPAGRRQRGSAPRAKPGGKVTWRIGDEERRCKRQGAWPVIGTDEAGRGPLAGPVVAAAVALRDGARLPGLDDSKALTEAQREALVPAIHTHALAWAVVEGSVEDITERNILGASLWAMEQAVRQVAEAMKASGQPAALVLVDGNRPIPGLQTPPQRALVKGDARSRAIAAASILAKVHRDQLLTAMERTYPGYGFAVHKGYPTPAHLQALRELGPCPAHRPTFRPVAELLAQRP